MIKSTQVRERSSIKERKLSKRKQKRKRDRKTAQRASTREALKRLDVDMTFSEAEQVTLSRSSKYKDQTIAKIAETDEGLILLDRYCQHLPKLGKACKAIKKYLGDPSIAKELHDILNERRGIALDKVCEEMETPY